MSLKPHIGRPKALADETFLPRLIEALTLGNTIKTSCAYANCHVQTYYNYIKAAQAGDETYFAFFDAVQKAKAAAQMNSVAKVRLAGDKGSWQAHAWWLERSDPENWALRTKVDVRGEVTTTFTLAIGDKVIKDVVDSEAREVADDDKADSLTDG